MKKPLLVLHLPLDEIRAPSPRLGAPLEAFAAMDVRKPPTIVPDETFGGCMYFDGDATQAPFAAHAALAPDEAGVQKGRAGFTISVWFQCAGFRPTPECLLQIGGRGWTLLCLVTQVGQQGRVQLSTGPVTGGSELQVNTWYHLAVCQNNAEKKLSMYLNGGSEGQTTSVLSLEQESLDLAMGGAAEAPFFGKIANLRVYQGPMDEAALKGLYTATDLSAQAAFKLTYPIDFRLVDDGSPDHDAENVLHISEAPEPNRVRLELTNTSGRNLEILDVPAGVAQFTLQFKPNTFPPRTLKASATAPWRCEVMEDPDSGMVSARFTCSEKTWLNAGRTLSFPLEYTSAARRGGARGTTAQLQYHGLRFENDKATLKGNRIAHVDIINLRGKRSVPLHAGFFGSNVVLKGKPNTLFLSITNVSQANVLNLNAARKDDGADEPSKFFVSLQSGPGPFELCADDQLKGIGVRPVQCSGPSKWLVDEHWDPVQPPDFQGQRPFEWRVSPAPGKTALNPGESLILELSHILTDKAFGSSVVTVRYENLPGYWDGTLTALIQKSPINYGDQEVEVATALKVHGNLTVFGELTVSRPATPRMVSGVVDAAGNIVSGSGGFEVKAVPGALLIKFNPRFAGPPTVVATLRQGAKGQPQLTVGNLALYVDEVTPEMARLRWSGLPLVMVASAVGTAMASATGGAALMPGFHFIAIGP